MVIRIGDEISIEQQNFLKWMSVHAPGYKDLTEAEASAAMQFSLLWSLFEAQALETSASAQAILKKVKKWDERGFLKDSEFEPFVLYFKKRYVENEKTNDRFKALHLRKNNCPELVSKVLLGENREIVDIIAALLVIVYRYRNNFFHGTKWAYGMRDQLGNFNTSNALLMKAIEINQQVIDAR